MCDTDPEFIIIFPTSAEPSILGYHGFKNPEYFFCSSENSSNLLGLTQYLRSPPKISWEPARTSIALTFFLLFLLHEASEKKIEIDEGSDVKKTKQKILGVRTPWSPMWKYILARSNQDIDIGILNRW